MRPRLSALILGFLFILLGKLQADTLYLKNGQSIEGFIQKEENGGVEFDLGYGTVKFEKREIERIYRSNPEESAKLRKIWEEDKSKSEWKDTQADLERKKLMAQWEEKKAQAEQERLREKSESKEVAMSKEKGQVVVNALLNHKVRASLVLDTGASLVLLTRNIAQDLGIDMHKEANSVELQMADGRKIKAQHAVLESVKIEDAEADNVEAAILLDELKDPGFKDGLLGMSFLSRFNFTVDHKNEKLILKKAK